MFTLILEKNVSWYQLGGIGYSIECFHFCTDYLMSGAKSQECVHQNPTNQPI